MTTLREETRAPALQLRRILLPTDFSGCANYALPYAEREMPDVLGCEVLHGLDVEEVIAHGDAAAEIVRVANEREVDLIVISSHGRTGLGRIIFGSTAEAIVRHARCPVLVVKPPPDEEEESEP